ncbi:MAG: hypothetical protein RID09_14180 [Coleofasciculus sp. G1-WW12-02]|uniref:hypothetical protein n=1 Tax=Coleofasciculus sp. G1-WW12-02 TaxID=3068483 RepID=UPI0032F1BF5B
MNEKERLLQHKRKASLLGTYTLSTKEVKQWIEKKLGISNRDIEEKGRNMKAMEELNDHIRRRQQERDKEL